MAGNVLPKSGPGLHASVLAHSRDVRFTLIATVERTSRDVSSVPNGDVDRQP